MEAARSAEESVISFSTAHSVRFGDPSADSVADGQSIAGGAGCVGQRSPEVRQRLSVSHVAENTIPPMPTLVPRELSEWMEDRQARRETRRDDRRHGSMISPRRPSAAMVFADATHPGPGFLRRNVLKRDGPCVSHRRSGPTQVDSDCEPLLHSGGVASSESEEGTQVVSVHHVPSHAVFEGRVAMPLRQISSRVSKRLRLGHQHGAADDVCEALEFDLTQGDSDVPPPLAATHSAPAISVAHPSRF